MALDEMCLHSSERLHGIIMINWASQLSAHDHSRVTRDRSSRPSATAFSRRSLILGFTSVSRLDENGGHTGFYSCGVVEIGDVCSDDWHTNWGFDAGGVGSSSVYGL